MASSYVLDASAFYAGTAFLAGRKCVTTSAVFDEVSHIKSSHAALEALMDAGNLSIIDAEKENIDAIVVAAKKTGDYGKLSKADISVLALAKQMNATLVSDDYAVANVAAMVGIAVEMSSGKGIKNVRKYVTYCSACSRAFGPNAKECPLCGNALKRKFKVTG